MTNFDALFAHGKLRTERQQAEFVDIASARLEQYGLNGRAKCVHEVETIYALLADEIVDLSGQDSAYVIDTWLKQRAVGVPLATLTHKACALGRWFDAPKGVLAPHPATEVLIDLCGHWLGHREQPQTGLEVGFGTGVVSLSLMLDHQNLTMAASDISQTAKQIALRNAEKHLPHSEQDRFTPLMCTADHEVMEPFFAAGIPQGKTDFIISNPPYLTPSDEISVEYRDHMPESALFSPDSDGLHFYRGIAERGLEFLKSDGAIFLEARKSRAAEVGQLFETKGLRVEVLNIDDIRNALPLDRMTTFNRARTFSNHSFVFASKMPLNLGDPHT